MSPAETGIARGHFGLTPLRGMAACLVIALLAMWDGAQHLASIWLTSPTYAHGALVPLVSLLLLADGWRKGEQLTSWPLALSGVGVGALGYLVGALLEVRLLQHVGVIATVIGIIATHVGRTASIRHRFALLFLLCAIPVGAELIPLLQEITARGVMLTLEVLGIRAVRVEMLIRTTVGDFEVEEACAGLKFLTAMAVTGILFAHLFYRTMWKQCAFVVAACVLPVIANVIRAAATVIVATRTDMKVAAGFDHLVYGWVFFFVIFAAIVGTGFFTAEKGAPVRPAPAVSSARYSPFPTLAILAMLAITGGVS